MFVHICEVVDELCNNDVLLKEQEVYLITVVTMCR